MKPADRAVFWIEFFMHHKGDKHLWLASHDLTLWISKFVIKEFTSCLRVRNIIQREKNLVEKIK
ncbi:hypothetical protein HPG69_001472 [Diceros bicornis minor]|uniref:Uncharacterized protein n=1 Tax=Diceros bicornis minor TaxID=77932 RepID=A0A7J7FFV2_DICBM|nr:hypothetical protein HPG69_001472 [Diceros bicornis minor]